ncbi:uncharacterized protein [Rutidosis leptorrhynchoides]|uniref:uncharacterized protein n=1 Tax=Rutidosis leptorrhynchoides TaxID=125765 RepID=UPI003A99A973
MNTGAVFNHVEPQYKLTSGEADFLERELDDSEIKDAVWNRGSSKVPGPDGISFRFIKKFWDLFKTNLCRDIRKFFSSCIMPHGAKSAFFSLIPKILTNRLLGIIDKIISLVQSAFISSLQILDGPLILSEILSWAKTNNKKKLLFKVDFEKAYDSVNWDYLFFMLSSMGFGKRCIGVNAAEVTSFANATGTRVGSFLTNYLGIPIGSNMKLKSSWEPLIDKFRLRLSSWKASLISSACSKATNDGLVPSDIFRMDIGNGRKTSFWHDVWCGNTTLASHFNRLYHLDMCKDDCIADKWMNGEWQFLWSRESIGSRNEQLVNDLRCCLSFCQLADRDDRWLYSLSNDGLYTVKSAREGIDQVALPSSHVKTIWFKFLPRKVNIFLWRLRLDSLPVRWNLSAKGIEINSIVCPVCNNGVETRDHLFFDCSVVKDLWQKMVMDGGDAVEIEDHGGGRLSGDSW